MAEEAKRFSDLDFLIQGVMLHEHKSDIGKVIFSLEDLVTGVKYETQSGSIIERISNDIVLFIGENIVRQLFVRPQDIFKYQSDPSPRPRPSRGVFSRLRNRKGDGKNTDASMLKHMVAQPIEETQVDNNSPQNQTAPEHEPETKSAVSSGPRTPLITSHTPSTKNEEKDVQKEQNGDPQPEQPEQPENILWDLSSDSEPEVQARSDRTSSFMEHSGSDADYRESGLEGSLISTHSHTVSTLSTFLDAKAAEASFLGSRPTLTEELHIGASSSFPVLAETGFYNQPQAETSAYVEARSPVLGLSSGLPSEHELSGHRSSDSEDSDVFDLNPRDFRGGDPSGGDDDSDAAVVQIGLSSDEEFVDTSENDDPEIFVENFETSLTFKEPTPPSKLKDIDEVEEDENPATGAVEGMFDEVPASTDESEDDILEIEEEEEIDERQDEPFVEIERDSPEVEREDDFIEIETETGIEPIEKVEEVEDEDSEGSDLEKKVNEGIEYDSDSESTSELDFEPEAEVGSDDEAEIEPDAYSDLEVEVDPKAEVESDTEPEVDSGSETDGQSYGNSSENSVEYESLSEGESEGEVEGEEEKESAEKQSLSEMSEEEPLVSEEEETLLSVGESGNSEDEDEEEEEEDSTIDKQSGTVTQPSEAETSKIQTYLEEESEGNGDDESEEESVERKEDQRDDGTEELHSAQETESSGDEEQVGEPKLSQVEDFKTVKEEEMEREPADAIGTLNPISNLRIQGDPVMNSLLNISFTYEGDGDITENISRTMVRWLRFNEISREWNIIENSSEMQFHLSADDVFKRIRVDVIPNGHEEFTVSRELEEIAMTQKLAITMNNFLSRGEAIFHVTDGQDKLQLLVNREKLKLRLGFGNKSKTREKFSLTESTRVSILNPNSVEIHVEGKKKGSSRTIVLHTRNSEQRDAVVVAIRKFTMERLKKVNILDNGAGSSGDSGTSRAGKGFRRIRSRIGKAPKG